MDKKLGLSIGFLSALAIFCGWYSFSAVLVVTALIFIVSDEEILKKNALNALFFSLIFLIVRGILGKLSTSYLTIVDTIYQMFRESIDYDLVTLFRNLDVAKYVNGFVGFVEFVLMIVFLIIAFKGKEVKIPLCNMFANKAMGLVAPKKAKEEAEDVTSSEATLTDIPEEEK